MRPSRPTPPPPPASTSSSLLQQPQVSHPRPSSSPAMPPTPRIPYIPLPAFTPSPSPSPPSSTSTLHPGPLHPNPHARELHPLLCYSQHSVPALIWDLRTDPTPASLLRVPNPTPYSDISATGIPILEHELYQPATAPPCHVLRLFCGIVPPTSTWGTITVTASSSRNGRTLDFVTVLDVLDAVRECMCTQITQSEWDALCEKQQDLVNRTFDSRWRMSETPAVTRMDGVLRQDCLLVHTLWGGLTLSFVEEDSAVLTLRPLPKDD